LVDVVQLTRRQDSCPNLVKMVWVPFLMILISHPVVTVHCVESLLASQFSLRSIRFSQLAARHSPFTFHDSPLAIRCPPHTSHTPALPFNCGLGAPFWASWVPFGAAWASFGAAMTPKGSPMAPKWHPKWDQNKSTRRAFPGAFVSCPLLAPFGTQMPFESHPNAAQWHAWASFGRLWAVRVFFRQLEVGGVVNSSCWNILWAPSWVPSERPYREWEWPPPLVF